MRKDEEQKEKKERRKKETDNENKEGLQNSNELLTRKKEKWKTKWA